MVCLRQAGSCLQGRRRGRLELQRHRPVGWQERRNTLPTAAWKRKRQGGQEQRPCCQHEAGVDHRRATEDGSDNGTLQLQRDDSQRKHYRLQQRRKGVHRRRTTPPQRRRRLGHRAKKDRNEPQRSKRAGGSRQVNVLEGRTHHSTNAGERQVCVCPAQRSSSKEASAAAAQEVGESNTCSTSGVRQNDHRRRGQGLREEAERRGSESVAWTSPLVPATLHRLSPPQARSPSPCP